MQRRIYSTLCLLTICGLAACGKKSPSPTAITTTTPAIPSPVATIEPPPQLPPPQQPVPIVAKTPTPQGAPSIPTIAALPKPIYPTPAPVRIPVFPEPSKAKTNSKTEPISKLKIPADPAQQIIVDAEWTTRHFDGCRDPRSNGLSRFCSRTDSDSHSPRSKEHPLNVVLGNPTRQF